MNERSYRDLKTIRFAGELLPKWAQLLDVAARLCSVPEDVREWFSRLTNSSGVDDSRTVIERCESLRASIRESRGALLKELARSDADAQPTQIIAAWLYALDTMIQQAEACKTCAWSVEGSEETVSRESDGGDISLRRL